MMKTRITMLAVAATLTLASASVQAANFDAKIVNLDGKPLLDEKGNEVGLTVRTVCVNALMAPLSQEDQAKPDSGVEKTKRMEMARRIQLNEPYTYSAEDISTLKKLINAMYSSPLVVGQAWKALEEK